TSLFSVFHCNFSLDRWFALVEFYKVCWSTRCAHFPEISKMGESLNTFNLLDIGLVGSSFVDDVVLLFSFFIVMSNFLCCHVFIDFFSSLSFVLCYHSQKQCHIVYKIFSPLHRKFIKVIIENNTKLKPWTMLRFKCCLKFRIS